MPAPAVCEQLPASRLRNFWTTQPSACGEFTSCGDPCGIPGLRYIDIDFDPPHPEHPIYPDASGPRRTIAINDWLYSLLINILNTRAKEPGIKGCGIPTTDVGGHWSESYRDDGLYNGTRIWTQSHKTYVSIQDAVRMLNAQLQADVGKLITMKVASAVEVSTVYKGKNRVEATIIVTKQAVDKTILTLTSERISSDWVWR